MQTPAALGAIATRTMPSVLCAAGSVVERSPVAGLERLGIKLRFARNAEIYAEGDDADRWYKVISGTVRSCKLLADGRRYIARFFFSGDFFGLDAAGTHGHAAEAVDDIVLLAYPRLAVERLAESDATLARRLRALVLLDLADAHRQVLLLGRKTALERVATFLLEVADRTECDHEIDLPMSRADIADHLGLTTETVSRTISLLKLQGVARVSSRAQRLALRDRTALAAIAG